MGDTFDEATLLRIAEETYFWVVYSDTGVEWPDLSESEKEGYVGAAERVWNRLFDHEAIDRMARCLADQLPSEAVASIQECREIVRGLLVEAAKLEQQPAPPQQHKNGD